MNFWKNSVLVNIPYPVFSVYHQSFQLVKHLVFSINIYEVKFSKYIGIDYQLRYCIWNITIERSKVTILITSSGFVAYGCCLLCCFLFWCFSFCWCNNCFDCSTTFHCFCLFSSIVILFLNWLNGFLFHPVLYNVFRLFEIFSVSRYVLSHLKIKKWFMKIWNFIFKIKSGFVESIIFW